MVQLGNIDHFIVFGADVTHPAPGARNDPGERSIAAIVGSRDRAAVRQASTFRWSLLLSSNRWGENSKILGGYIEFDLPGLSSP